MSQPQFDSTHFQAAEPRQMLELAEQIDRAAVKLPLIERFIYAPARVDTRTEGQMAEFLDWVTNRAVAGRAGESLRCPGFCSRRTNTAGSTAWTRRCAPARRGSS